MATRRINEPKGTESRRPPATTPEARQNQLIALSFDLVEKKLRDGTASSQEVTHFLKLGSTREKLEEERLALENQLTGVKMEALASQKRVEELYESALKAMKSYSGQEDLEMQEDEEYHD